MLPLDLYKMVSDDSVTNLNAAKMSYLVSLAGKSDLLDAEVITVPGKVFKKNGFTRYDVDDKALFEIILDVFYDKE